MYQTLSECLVSLYPNDKLSDHGVIMQLFTLYDQHIEMTVNFVGFNVTVLHIEGWGEYWSWIGLRYVDGAWNWHGRPTLSVSSSDSIWTDELPAPASSANNRCGYTLNKYSSMEKINDYSCTHNFHYIAKGRHRSINCCAKLLYCTYSKQTLPRTIDSFKQTH